MSPLIIRKNNRLKLANKQIKFKKIKKRSPLSIDEDEEEEILPKKKQRLLLTETIQSTSSIKRINRRRISSSSKTPPTPSPPIIKSSPPSLNIKTRKRRIIKVYNLKIFFFFNYLN